MNNKVNMTLNNGIFIISKPEGNKYLVRYKCGCEKLCTYQHVKLLVHGLCNNCLVRTSPTLRHGHAKRSTEKRGRYTKTYKIWLAMRRRCEDPKNGSYCRYGGVGIKVCERWGLFDNFLEDMGEHPGGDYQIDRIDNEGDYQLSNCRWVPRRENYRNKRTTYKIEYKGNLYSLRHICEILSLDYKSVWYQNSKNNMPLEVLLGNECTLIYSPQ